MSLDLYDEAYASYERSPVARNLFGSVLDPDLPPGIEPYSFLTRMTLDLVQALVGQVDVNRLLDLGCGRGGPGLWLAQQRGCELLGLDRSRVAVAAATSRRRLFTAAPEREQAFVQADLAALPVRSGSVDAVVCLDTIQTFDQPGPVLREVARVLRPGGRFVATTWQAVDLSDQRVAQRLRVDHVWEAERHGFSSAQAVEIPEAHTRELALARAAVALSPSLIEQELILRRVVAEAIETLAQEGLTRRILLTADTPVPPGLV